MSAGSVCRHLKIVGRVAISRAMLLLAAWLVTVSHEFAHGMTSKVFGGRTTEVGALTRPPYPITVIGDLILEADGTRA
jgi:hypothetical protein